MASAVLQHGFLCSNMGLRYTKQKALHKETISSEEYKSSKSSVNLSNRNSPTLEFHVIENHDNSSAEVSSLQVHGDVNASVSIEINSTVEVESVGIERESLESNSGTESPSFDNVLTTYSTDTTEEESASKGSPVIHKYRTLPSRMSGKNENKHRHSVTLGDGYFRHLKPNGRDKELRVQSNEEMISKSADKLRRFENWPQHSNESVFMPNYPLDHRKLSRYQVCDKLGSGAFSQVFMVIEKESSVCYALKKLQKSSIITKKMMKQVQDEIYILFRIGRHKFILGLITCWQTKGYLCQVLPYVPGGDLYKLWKKEKIFSMKCVSHAGAEIAVALDYLFSKKILYRDLKMENILISRTGHVLLSDFGLSKCMDEGTRAYTICGTLRYMAPEIATGTGYSYESDWWSLGVIIVAMATGKFPFKLANDHKDMLKEIKASILNLPKLSDDVVIKDTIRKLLNYRPWHRFSSLREIQEMVLFSHVNFSEILTETYGPFYKFISS